MRVEQLLVGGQSVDTDEVVAVADKFDGSVIAEVACASPAHVDAAAAAAWRAYREQPLSPHRRYEILRDTATILSGRKQEVLDTFVAETGFTVGEAEVDFARTVETLVLSAHEAKRIAGSVVPFGGARGAESRVGFTLRLPIGPVCAITPFNSPLNTVAHKIAPAVAAGNPFVVKPAMNTPLSAFALCRAMLDAGLPGEWASVLVGSGSELGPALAGDERFRFFAFTGSTAVGDRIQRAIGVRKSQMELGAICSTIVCADADPEFVAPRAVAAALRKAGQVCTSLQRLVVAESQADAIIARVTELTAQQVVGDPRDAKTDVGPMISEGEAQRAQGWIAEALESGARAHTKVGRNGAVLNPTVLSAVTPEMRVASEEIFAPVVVVLTFRTLDEAFALVNNTPYGLAAGIFTDDWRVALRAAHELDVGVVQIGETSSSRVDLMPFGGTRNSGFGKEGPHYAVEEMSFDKLVVFHR